MLLAGYRLDAKFLSLPMLSIVKYTGAASTDSGALKDVFLTCVAQVTLGSSPAAAERLHRVHCERPRVLPFCSAEAFSCSMSEH